MNILEKFRLDGKTALVTGGGTGIGRTFALALAEAGADVAIAGRNVENIEKVEKEIIGLGRQSLAIKADVTIADDVKNMVDAIIKEWGKLDIGVNNAGYVSWANAEDMTELEWDKTIDTNLKGVFLCAQAESRVMIPRKSGKIINTASCSAYKVNKPQKQVAYNASKAGLIQLTHSMAVEWAPYGITVNSISPGYTVTPMIDVDPIKKLVPEWLKMIPMGRMCELDELKGAVVYLAGDVSSYVTGHDLVVDGGFIL